MINEALEIARRFSTPESVQFINGVLDSVASELGEAKRVGGVQLPQRLKQRPKATADYAETRSEEPKNKTKRPDLHGLRVDDHQVDTSAAKSEILGCSKTAGAGSTRLRSPSRAGSIFATETVLAGGR